MITTRSGTNGWVYQAGIPRSVLMENANKIKHMTWLITAGALFLGLLAGLVLAYRNSMPINRLLAVMKEQFGKEDSPERNEFDFLSGNIADMITKNKLLETELNRQLPLVRDAFLKRLIAGEFESREEIVSAAEQADIGLGEGTGYAGILQIKGYSGMDSVEILNELNAARLLLKQTFAELAGPLPMTDMGSDKIVILFFSSPADGGPAGKEDGMERLMDQGFSECLRNTAFRCRAASGSISRRLLRLASPSSRPDRHWNMPYIRTVKESCAIRRCRLRIRPIIILWRRSSG